MAGLSASTVLDQSDDERTEAVVGKDYRKVPSATGRYNWKCLVPGCPTERTFTRKEYFNQHLDQIHPTLGLKVTASEPSGRKRGPNGREASMEELAELCKKGKGFFPARWKMAKMARLKQTRQEVVTNYLTTKLDWLRRREEVPHLGPEPDLLLALRVIGEEYLPTWDMLKVDEFRAWLHGHLDALTDLGRWRHIFQHTLVA